MVAPVETGSKAGDTTLAIVSAPFQILGNLVMAPAQWFPKSQTEEEKKKDEEKNKFDIEEEDLLSPELLKHFTSPITLEDYFSMIPADYRRSGKCPITAFITPAYKKLYDHFFSSEKMIELKKTLSTREIIYRHLSLLLEVLIEYFFDQHFLQILYECEEAALVASYVKLFLDSIVLIFFLSDPVADTKEFCLVPSTHYSHADFKSKYIVSSATSDVKPPSMPSTWLPGDIGRASKSTDQLIAYIRFYQTQLRHAATRIDREAARLVLEANLTLVEFDLTPVDDVNVSFFFFSDLVIYSAFSFFRLCTSSKMPRIPTVRVELASLELLVLLRKSVNFVRRILSTCRRKKK